MFLRRKIEKTLDDYYKNPDAKILIVEGARQIGKSYIIRKTAKAHFRYYVEISFSNANFRNIFQNILTIDRFYLSLTGFLAIGFIMLPTPSSFWMKSNFVQD